MSTPLPSLLRLQPLLYGRPWGGRRLADIYGPEAPEGPLGEAWLASDHVHGDSIVVNLPGETLHALMARHAEAIVGTGVPLAPGDRFPVLLKILHATEPLSVQVHPDDALAAQLGEPDGGKTEMWYTLDAELDAHVYRGFAASETAAGIEAAMRDGTVPQRMTRVPLHKGDCIFVPARTVHAIGGGLLIAEIQQNSDLTYRMYDWGRTDAQGRPRELHIEKALTVSNWEAGSPKPDQALGYNRPGCRRSVLGACPWFAAEAWSLKQQYSWQPNGAWRLLLGLEGNLEIEVDGDREALPAFGVLLIPASAGEVTLRGEGKVAAFYRPDFERDLRQPLEIAGHAAPAIQALWHQ
ncbi:MAG: hypothetical protein GC168_07855 [Candidatus Hydrogenedens sp.]|nr:hypothetical protein [Candidatus Hydrogenedens sp.]